uniref:Amine oxidase n=1 Tax=Corvus moneduloides TaxID=1196302 RepID=A0A8U7NCJ8_CORMO
GEAHPLSPLVFHRVCHRVVLPGSDKWAAPISFLVLRYQLAVTRRKEEEPTSTSIYNQNDPWTPTVTFADFINNETITNEDLVAWITAGFLHIPHSEDIPNTVTVGNSVGFLLRPYNYYDLDPSIYSHDGCWLGSGTLVPLLAAPSVLGCSSGSAGTIAG